MFIKPVIISLLCYTASVIAQDNVFDKDPRLTQSFWGMAYSTPGSASYPTCGVDTLPAVVKDIQFLSQVTTRLRTYGADCNQTELILDAIQRTQANITVYLGIYISDDPAVYERQRDATFAALQKYGTANVAGLTVGNEFQLVASQAGADAATAQTLLTTNIVDTRTKLAALNLDRVIPVGTAEVTSFVSAALVDAADYVMANAHPYFANATIDNAATMAQTTLVDPTRQIVTGAGKTMFMGEVGWPSDGTGKSHYVGVPSVANEQAFIDSFVCDANNKDTGYFYFELMDSYWKPETDPTIEKFWGLFDKDKNLKVQIPLCSDGVVVGTAGPGTEASSTGSPTSASKSNTASGTTTPKPTNTGAAGRAYSASALLLSLTSALWMISPGL